MYILNNFLTPYHFWIFGKNEKKLGGNPYCFLAKNGRFWPKNSKDFRLTFFSFSRKFKNDRASKSRLGCIISVSKTYMTISNILHMTLNFFSKIVFFVFLGQKWHVEPSERQSDLRSSDMTIWVFWACKPVQSDTFSYISRPYTRSRCGNRKT